MFVITAFSRPNFFNNMKENFERQNFLGKKLIVVENGSAIGVCKSHNFFPDVLMSSENHQSYAKNVGIEWIKNHGGGWWTTFDDDDYYGPEYLNKIDSNKHKAEIIGQMDLFVRTRTGMIRLFENLGKNTYVEGVHGSTISAQAENCPYFVNNGIWGEDWKFIEDYAKKGGRCWATDPSGHVLRRHDNNTWQVRDDSLVRRMTYSSGGKCVIKEFGPENEKTLGVVNGQNKSPYVRIYSDGDIIQEDSEAYNLIVKNSMSLNEFADKFLDDIRSKQS